MKPFVDFYSANEIAPVRQDISDRQRHFQRRIALYRHLGIPTALIAGRSVIEFGPGAGHNAIVTASFKPARYLLVDGNPASLKATREILAQERAQNCEVVSSYIEEFKSDERFDIVLCEGVIPFQIDPGAFARHVAGFAKPGGIVVVTCIDGISFLGESTRRLLADTLVPFKAPPAERLSQLRTVFEPHLKTLKGMSRLVDDWMYDNILVPYSGNLFSLKDAIEALSDANDVYGVSPHFFTDWRWYKDVWGDQSRYNERGIGEYLTNILNLADYRVMMESQPPEKGGRVLRKAEALFLQMRGMENAGNLEGLDSAVSLVREIADEINPVSDLTGKSLREVAAAIEQRGNANLSVALPNFQSFFGRGQQYVSFIRRA
jgi:2-polyprenyl-3-methyl-5-hydroxy-6-metoxy-1,4-benzoquinol methylase